MSLLYKKHGYDRYLFWSSSDERWKVDLEEHYADEVKRSEVYGWIYSTSNVGCPGDNSIWSQYLENAVFIPDPNLSVKMLCRTNYGNQENLTLNHPNIQFSVCYCPRTECHVEPRNPKAFLSVEP